jgi:hypothetical protein
MIEKISVIIKNAKIDVDGLGGVDEEFVVGNVLGDSSCGSTGGGAGGRFAAGEAILFTICVYYVCLLYVFTICVYYMCLLYILCIFTMYNMYKLIYKNNIIM